MQSPLIPLTWLCIAAAALPVRSPANEAPPPLAAPEVVASPAVPAESSAGPAEPRSGATPAEAADPAPSPAVTGAVLRDPFWPVGYVPSSDPIPAPPVALPGMKPSDVVRPPAPVIEWPTLKVRGVTRGAGGREIALVDNVGLAEEGGVIQVKSRGVIYRWRVARIEGSEVKFERLSADPIVDQDRRR